MYKLHGLSLAIVTDRNRIFTSLFWKELFALADVQLQMTSAYHPQSDGQTERLNQTMETFLRCFVNACPPKWSQWLPFAKFWYNTSEHSAIGHSPFKAPYGYAPCHFGISALVAVSSVDLHTWLQERQLVHSLVKQHLTRSRLRMKKQADKGRFERPFSTDDMVYLKLQPYVKSSLASRANQKLAFKYFGQFKVLSHVGQVAYKLELPSSSTIHPVFHVSQLKPVVSSSVQVIPSVPSYLVSPRIPESVPAALPSFQRRPTSLASAREMVRLDGGDGYLGRSGGPEARVSVCACLGSSGSSSEGECQHPGLGGNA